MCACTGLYEFLRDQGSFIGGCFALIAGAIAYWAGRIQAKATKEASDRQIAEAARKDQLQGRCLALAIYVELIAIQAEVEELDNAIFSQRFSSSADLTTPARRADLTSTAKLSEPIFTSNNSSDLYLIGKSGGTVAQLISTILQYNNFIVEKTAKMQFYDAFANLGGGSIGHVRAIQLLLEQAMQ